MSLLNDLISSALSPKAIEYRHFPTRYQAVIFRNWEMLPPSRLAEVLKTDEITVINSAKEMGLRTPPVIDNRWLERGYITIIRNNWHLLPVSQLIKILGWSEEQLAYSLKEDDFLWIKLGSLKPAVETVIWRPLNDKEKKKTEKLKNIMVKYFPQESEWRPFDFLDDLSKPMVIKPISAGLPKPGEITLDAGWKVVFPAESNFLAGVVERFSRHIFQAFGFTLLGKEKTILLQLEPDAAKLSESHSIDIQTSTISIKAVDEAGLMRGLLWLEESLIMRESPCIEIAKIVRNTQFDLRLIYPYAAVYSDPFTDPKADPFPEGLLERLAQAGINGLWLQAVLYTLVPFPFDLSLSAAWEERIMGLNRLIAKARKYGISTYLYLNEPRAMPLGFFKNRPDLAGARDEAYGCLCTSKKAVQNYLRDSCERLFTEAPDLAGVITITMSENLTNCFSRGGAATCPECARRKPYEIVGEVNRCIEEGVHRASPHARVICWNWAWTEKNGWSCGELSNALSCLPSNAQLMCTSESDMEFTIGGISGKVSDYILSIPGPGIQAEMFWQEALSIGFKCMAKVQMNNTWECASVPYLPVIDLVYEHLDNLRNCGVTGLMVSWTLGGYPSRNLKLASRYYWQEIKTGSTQNAKDDTSISALAQTRFSNALRSFPFHIGVLYNAPQNVGPMNLLLPEKSGYPSTMICYPYDDLEGWRSIYPVSVFISQFRQLCEEWQKGVEILECASPNPALEELTTVARSAGYHFTSAYMQALYVKIRDSLPNMDDTIAYNTEIEKLRTVISKEQSLAILLWQMMDKDSRIGFEASNHYFYTEGSLKEKVINCQYLLDKVFVPLVKQTDLSAALGKLGITTGDIVLVHSSLSSMGKVINGAESIIGAFESVLGEEGTLVFPTLSQKDFEHSYETWSMDKPSDVGYLTEYFRKLHGVSRSDQATHSVAAKGRYALKLTCEHTAFGPRYGVFGDYAFSRSSPWQKMYDLNGKIVFIGVSMQVNTFKHFMEYRFVDEALALICDDQIRQCMKDRIWSFKHFKNQEDRIWPFINGEQLQNALESAGLIRKAICGKAELICVNIRDMIDNGMKWITEDPETWFLTDVMKWIMDAKDGMK